MKKVEVPLFIMESEVGVFQQKHPEYSYFVRVYYKDNTLAGYLAYIDEPEN